MYCFNEFQSYFLGCGMIDCGVVIYCDFANEFSSYIFLSKGINRFLSVPSTEHRYVYIPIKIFSLFEMRV